MRVTKLLKLKARHKDQYIRTARTKENESRKTVTVMILHFDGTAEVKQHATLLVKKWQVSQFIACNLGFRDGFITNTENLQPDTIIKLWAACHIARNLLSTIHTRELAYTLQNPIYICTDNPFQLHVIASEHNLEIKCQVTYCSENKGKKANRMTTLSEGALCISKIIPH